MIAMACFLHRAAGRREGLSGLDLPLLQCAGYNASFVFLRNVLVEGSLR